VKDQPRNPNEVHFIFYKAKGSFTDKVIKLASGRWRKGKFVFATYSHVEYVINKVSEDTYVCISASKRDGNKIRSKRIHIKEGHWDHVVLTGDHQKATLYALSQAGRPYSTLGAVLSITPWKKLFWKELFCSHFMGIIANKAGLHVPDPHTLTPDELARCIKANNKGVILKKDAA